MRFRKVPAQKVPVQILRLASGAEGIGAECSGVDIEVRLRKVPVQILRKVPVAVKK